MCWLDDQLVLSSHIDIKDYGLRYWPVVQRLVLLGWIVDARDLLYLHSDNCASEDPHSMLAKVRCWAMRLDSNHLLPAYLAKQVNV